MSNDPLFFVVTKPQKSVLTKMMLEDIVASQLRKTEFETVVPLLAMTLKTFIWHENEAQYVKLKQT